MLSTRPPSAATDVTEFISDLDGGQFELLLSQALSESAAATVDHKRKSLVVVTFSIDKITGTHQVQIQHDLKFSRPTSLGKVTQETSGQTVLHVGAGGALSLAQPSLLERELRQQKLPQD